MEYINSVKSNTELSEEVYLTFRDLEKKLYQVLKKCSIECIAANKKKIKFTI